MADGLYEYKNVMEQTEWCILVTWYSHSPLKKPENSRKKHAIDFSRNGYYSVSPEKNSHLLCHKL